MIVTVIMAIVLLTGCDSLYYRDLDGSMTVTVIQHSDADELFKHCGGALACAIIAGRFCTVHIPERSGYMLDHEVTHCYGRVDAPQHLRIDT